MPCRSPGPSAKGEVEEDLPGGCLLPGVVPAPRGCACSQGLCLLPGGCLLPRGCLLQGVPAPRGRLLKGGVETPQQSATVADGMHPTGMPSCKKSVTVRFSYK